MSNQSSDNGAESGDADGSGPDERRRRLLVYLGVAGLAGAGVATGWYATRDDDAQTSDQTPTGEPTDDTDQSSSGGVPAVVRRYAPDLYFGRLEKWFPTDPREFVDETAEGPQVVEGFTALEEYSRAYKRRTDPPNPTVFYRTVEATDDIDAIQYYFYSAFDQFSVNFHWHDWELLQVFVDTETGDPLLLCASAHKSPVPNNEVLEPDLSNGRRPGVLSEVGSHSSATEVNGRAPNFDRVHLEDAGSDVTNDFVDIVSSIRLPFAYGLPRDEGARLPFLEPEYEGTTLYRHDELSVDQDDFVDQSVTVDDWRELSKPPTDLPKREPGLVLTHPESDTEADAHYTLEPMADLPPVIESFEGPTLSFSLTVPGFLEDRVSEHVTDVGTPWEEDRYSDPLVDVTDEGHRRRLEGDAPDAIRNRVVGRIRQLRSGTEGALDEVSDDAREALEDVASVSFSPPPTEAVVQLASSDPVASATRHGMFGFLRADPGEHRLVVDGPGYAPLAQRFVHDGGTHRVGGDGDLGIVANEDAAWIKGDGRQTTGVSRVRIVEDYAGVVYDGRPALDDRFAVAVHRAGRYSIRIEDADGRSGSYRVRPEDFDGGEEDEDAVVFDRLETGKGSLVDSLREYIVDLRDLAGRLQERDGAEGRVRRQIVAALEEVDGARNAIEQGGADDANERLRACSSSLETGLDVLYEDGQGGYTDPSVAALAPRLRTAIERVDVAIATDLA